MKFFNGFSAHGFQDRILRAIESLEAELGLSVTIHDRMGRLTNQQGALFFRSRMVHQHPYCAHDRFAKPNWNNRCVHDCQLEAEAIATSERRPFLHHCWKGVSELIAPALHNGTVILVIYAGVFKYRDHVPNPGAPREMEREYAKLPTLDDSQLERYKDILLLAGQGMISLILNHEDHYHQPTRKTLIQQYIVNHAHDKATLGELSKTLCLSLSRTRHLVIEEFGAPFHELLTRERVNRSRNLLISSEAPLKLIASNVGIENVYYFSRCFKKYFGIPPAAYRKKMRRLENAKPSHEIKVSEPT